MSDAKPRRAGRDAARGDVAAGEGVPPEAAPMTIAPEGAPAGPDAAAQDRPEAIDAPLPSSHPTAVAGPAAAPVAQLIEESAELSQPAADAWTVLAEMQAALARGCEELALEMTAIARSDIATATDAATAMLGARTFAEAVEISAGLIRRRADAMIEGSTRLSEIGAQAATAASRPILARLAAPWSALASG